MEIKAKDMCPRCKHCLGMTHQGMYSCGKANDGSELNIGIDVILNCANFEWKDGKVEGKVSDICSKCKNCKGTTNEYDGNDFVVITGVKCEDPYDGMTKTLTADSDICCSMFEPKPACEKCERFDGTYCHSPEGIFVTSYMATGNCSFYSEKKEKEPCDEISCLQHELEMDKLRSKIHELEKEKAAHLKGIERLKKSQEKLQKRNDNQITMIQGLKLQYNDLKKSSDRWRELYNSLSETCADYDKRCKEECEKKYRNEISKLQNIVTEKEVEIKGLKKEIINLGFDRATVKNIMKKNIEFNKTISDQKVTIKALLITIKEMCKEENENA